MVYPPGLSSDKIDEELEKQSVSSSGSDFQDLSTWQIHRATRTRMSWSLITSGCLFLAFVFLLVVETGSVRNQATTRDLWFIKLNLSNVIPESIPNSLLLNSIARTVGLHDFYTVGLWNYCEGYNDQGFTDCAPAQAGYWFDPISIIKGELLAGASIQLPQNVSDILNIIKVASRVMFGFFLTGAVLSFILIFANFVSVYSRWFALVLGTLNLLNALFITVASVIATVMFVIIKKELQEQNSVDIKAQIGNTMFASMWIASVFAIIAFIVQLSLICCCASRRDVKKGKKRGSEKAYNN